MFEKKKVETKVCSKCGKELPLSEFPINKSAKDGVSNMCKDCWTELKSHPRKPNLSKASTEDLYKELDRRNLSRQKEMTPRELMQKLHELGYSGELQYTKVERINIGAL